MSVSGSVDQETEPRRRTWLLAGSLGAALAASACCLGPLVFALLGLGGAGLLVKFAPLRPYFVAATVGLLATGFYFAYGRRPVAPASAEGAACACEVPRANKAGRVALWVVAALVVALLVSPYVIPLVAG